MYKCLCVQCPQKEGVRFDRTGYRRHDHCDLNLITCVQSSRTVTSIYSSDVSSLQTLTDLAPLCVNILKCADSFST